MVRINTLLSALVLFSLSCLVNSEEINYLIVEDIAEPFQIANDGQSKGGIVSEIVDEIFAGSSYTVKHRALPLNRLYTVIESKDLKNWIIYDAKVWNVLKQWRQLVDEPLFPVSHSYLTCRNTPSTQINSVNDIKQQRIAVIKGFDYPELSELSKKSQLELISVSNYVQGINLAALSRVDGFVEMDLRMRFTIKTASINHPCLQFVDMSPIIPAYSIYLSTDKNDASGVNGFAKKRIKELKKSGFITEVLKRYTSPHTRLPANSSAGLLKAEQG